MTQQLSEDLKEAEQAYERCLKHVTEAKAGRKYLKDQLKKNPMDADLTSQLAGAEVILHRHCGDRDAMKKKCDHLQKQLQQRQDQEAQETKEKIRKETLFKIFDDIIFKWHITAIPEYRSGTDPWKNIRWWDPSQNRWVKCDEVNIVFSAFKDQVNLHQYLDEKRDVVELNEYIQRHSSRKLTEWDTYLYFQNGVLVDGVLVVNQYDYYVITQYNFALIRQADMAIRLDRAFLIHRLGMVTSQWEEICWWVGHAIRQSPMEYFLFFLGPPSGGKTPWATVVSSLFDRYGTDSLTELGEKSGLATWWDKRINIDFDANIAFLPNNSVAKIKQIFGDDPTQSIRLLFQSQFQWKVSPYFLVLINTMPKINQGINTNALFKRSRICEFNCQLNDDPSFKEIIKEQEFLNLFGSFCYWKSFEDHLRNGDLCNRRLGRLQDFMADTERQWMDSAYPVRKAIFYLLRRSVEVDEFLTSQHLSAVVQKWFKSKDHNTLQVSLPTNLIGEITEAVKLLGGSRVRREKNDAYLGVYWTPEGFDFQTKVKSESEPTAQTTLPEGNDWFSTANSKTQIKTLIQGITTTLKNTHPNTKILFADIWECLVSKGCNFSQTECMKIFQEIS